MKSNCKSQVIKKSIGLCSRDKSRVDSPDCLPNGWKVELKYLKSGPKEGGKYKCYVDPVTGCKFYSMKDVARYLNTEMLSNCPSELTSSSKMLSNCPSELTSSSTDVNSKDNRKDSIDGLPPGWVKEVKVRKTGGRKDPYYSHPECEYIFRSKLDVFRYVESGKIGRLALKRKKQEVDNVKVEECTSSPGGAKRQKLRVRASGRRLFTEDGSGVCGSEGPQVLEPNVPEGETLPSHDALDLDKNVQISEPVVPKGGVPPSNDASGLGGDCAEMNGFISLERKNSEERQMETDCTESKAELDRSLDNGVEKCTIRKTPRVKRKNNEKAPTIPRRSSERLAALRVEQSPKLGTRNRVGQRVAVQSGSRKADQTISSAKRCQIHQSKVVCTLASVTDADVISEVSKVTTDGESVPERSHPLGVEEQSIICGNGLCPRLEPTNEFGKLDGTQVTCGLEGERADEKPESPLVSPFGDSWPDPCLEFAFKTLTGAIPVEESLVIEDYLKVQLSSNNQKTGELTQPGFVADGICRTEHFRFDTRVNPSDVPEMKWNPAFPASSNEPKLNYGNSILKWDGERKK